MSGPIKIDGVSDQPTELKHIPVANIRENVSMLRPVDRENEQYILLAESVKNMGGVLTPISVREIPNPDPNSTEQLYGIVDGLQRWTACKDAGIKTIPAQVTRLADADVEEAQILANIHKVETKPAQYSKALLRMLSRNPTLTQAELAARLSQSPAWLKARLSLNDLDDKIAQLVDEGKIKLSNAYPLTILPKEEQVKYVERAMTEDTQTFAAAVRNINAEIRKARAQGREAVHTFQPQPRLQKVNDIKEQLANLTIVKAIIMNSGTTDVLEAARLTLEWVLHLDANTVAADKAKWEAKQKEAEELRIKRKAERDAKKAEEAKATQLDLTKL